MLPKRLLLLVFAFVVSWFGGCFGGSSLPSEVENAMEDAGDPEQTFPVIQATGSLRALQDGVLTNFPAVLDLIAGGSEARDAMLDEFSGTPAFEDDVKLAIFAYALEQMGDEEAVSALQSFLEDNITGDLYLTPQFLTYAIRALSGESVAYDISYTATEMQDATLLTSFDLAPNPKNQSSSTSSCHRQYVLMNGTAMMTYTDAGGRSQNAVVSGAEFSSATVPDNVRQNFINAVSEGGGTYVTNDATFQGSPTRQFNCAGYAFRELNGGGKWNADAGKMYDVLTRSGVLVEVSEGEAQQGDKVFYFSSSGSTHPGHVAEVQSVESGWISNTITVRNADNQSGLFEADIDASYYSQYTTRRIFRWAGGSAPLVLPDPSVSSNDAYCGASSGSSGSNSLTASFSISGFSPSFSPTSVAAGGDGTFTGTITVTGIPTILASEGTGTNVEIIMILFDKRQISGTGTYNLNESDKVFEDQNGEAFLSYSGPTITDVDDGSQVGFKSTGGTVTLTSYGTTSGSRLTGSYNATVSGNRTIGTDDYGSPINQTVTGTISGTFDVEIE